MNYDIKGQEANLWLQGLANMSDEELEEARIGFEDHARNRGAGTTGTAWIMVELIEKEQAKRREG